MNTNIDESWKNILQSEFKKDSFKSLTKFIKSEYQNHQCYPEAKNIFAAFNLCNYLELKVVIIGQDPYHGEGQANGLCFSVSDGISHPPSLKNIIKELKSDIGPIESDNGNFTTWAKQGVLLLNATLTVRENEPGSHQNMGWEKLTDGVIEHISKDKDQIVFLLWGKFAESKLKLIDSSKHKIFVAPHPSPLGAWRGWFGCKHFSKTNDFLKNYNKKIINW
ncbi:uracil-DNA glycosylase [Flavobacteriaceae bacterium]|nr:uracil-DNA glycosylase [Flavobacteriaceae bacterium]MDC0636738.1 uracil-DNA glycosylase [Flavobacteriaceae bacterium]MDC3345044.1 uracil-DNA glycosylase [Flavobacteriaceae bacterium]